MKKNCKNIDIFVKFHNLRNCKFVKIVKFVKIPFSVFQVRGNLVVRALQNAGPRRQAAGPYSGKPRHTGNCCQVEKFAMNHVLKLKSRKYLYL